LNLASNLFAFRREFLSQWSCSQRLVISLHRMGSAEHCLPVDPSKLHHRVIVTRSTAKKWFGVGFVWICDLECTLSLYEQQVLMKRHTPDSSIWPSHPYRLGNSTPNKHRGRIAVDRRRSFIRWSFAWGASAHCTHSHTSPYLECLSCWLETTLWLQGVPRWSSWKMQSNWELWAVWRVGPPRPPS
jgi:hypothetical protein